MAGKRNRLGRVYEPGKALQFWTFQRRDNWNVQWRIDLTGISNDVKVTVRGVNETINRHGVERMSWQMMFCIWKFQRPSIYAREIQNRRLIEGICDRDKLLSISAINRSHGGKLGMKLTSVPAYKCANRIRCQPFLISFPTLRETS